MLLFQEHAFIFKRNIYLKLEINQLNILQKQPPGDVLEKIQLAFTCSKLTMESLEQGVKFVQS